MTAALPAKGIPPQDLDAEQSVLGGMLLSKDAIADVVEIGADADGHIDLGQLEAQLVARRGTEQPQTLHREARGQLLPAFCQQREDLFSVRRHGASRGEV